MWRLSVFVIWFKDDGGYMCAYIRSVAVSIVRITEMHVLGGGGEVRAHRKTSDASGVGIARELQAFLLSKHKLFRYGSGSCLV